VKDYPTLEFMLPAAAAATGVQYVSFSVKKLPLKIYSSVVTVCALLTRYLFAIAKFLVKIGQRLLKLCLRLE